MGNDTLDDLTEYVMRRHVVSWNNYERGNFDPIHVTRSTMKLLLENRDVQPIVETMKDGSTVLVVAGVRIIQTLDGNEAITWQPTHSS